ncbi:MAG: OsmC family protein [Halofilum sp. (in: g-proteobacteria)]
MRATVTWQGDARFLGESGSGHQVLMAGPPSEGGADEGPRPTEMVLLGLGGCSAFDVVNILERSRRPPASCHVEIEAERAETDPKVFTRIHLHFVVSGSEVTEKQLDRAVQLSADKYCSVARMLATTATITHDWELREA